LRGTFEKKRGAATQARDLILLNDAQTALNLEAADVLDYQVGNE